MTIWCLSLTICFLSFLQIIVTDFIRFTDFLYDGIFLSSNLFRPFVLLRKIFGTHTSRTFDPLHNTAYFAVGLA